MMLPRTGIFLAFFYDPPLGTLESVITCEPLGRAVVSGTGYAPGHEPAVAT